MVDISIVIYGTLSQDNLEIHRAGFQTVSMHNLSDLVQHALVTNVIPKLLFLYLYIIKLVCIYSSFCGPL